MQILDQYGNPARHGLQAPRTFAYAADRWSGARPWQPCDLGDIDRMIPPSDRHVLVAVSRLMMENWGPIRAIGRQIPMYVLGCAWKPSNASQSTRYRNNIEDVIRNRFWPLAFLNTPSPDMTSGLYHMLLALLRDGEYFVMLTKRRTGAPAFQIIPCHRIGQRTGGSVVEDASRYRGLPVRDGVVKNRLGQIVAYHYLGDTPEEDRYISARSIVHRMLNDYPEGSRGIPIASHGLNDARDSVQSHDWERFNLLYRSSRTVIETNETGTNEHPDDYFRGVDAIDREGSEGSAAGPHGSRVEMLQGGTTQFFKAGTGSKLELLRHDNPGDIYESFGNRMIRAIYTGVPWPYSFGWEGHNRGGGTSERRDIEQARWTIDRLQSMVEIDMRRMVGYASAVYANIGEAPSSPDWWRWTFTRPRKLTVDDGRTQKAQLDMHARGLISDDDVLEGLGKDPDDYWHRVFKSAARKELAFLAAQEEFGVMLDPRVKGVLSVNEQLPEPAYDPNPALDDGDDDESDDGPPT